MSFSGFLGALLFVCVGVVVVAGAWIAVRWAGDRWPNGTEDVEAGPFTSWRAALDQVQDGLRTLEAEVLKLRTENQLVRQEWTDAWDKMRRSEERTRKARQRAKPLLEDEEEEEEGELRQFPMFPPTLQPDAPAAEPPAEPRLIRRYRQKYGNGGRA